MVLEMGKGAEYFARCGIFARRLKHAPLSSCVGFLLPHSAQVLTCIGSICRFKKLMK